jgi:hypothetical protein
MSSSKRARTIFRAAWQTLRANPRLVWFAVLLGIVSMMITAVSGVLGWLGVDAMTQLVTAGLDAPPEASTYGRAAITVGLMVWFGTHLVAPFFGVALATATMHALASRPWSVRESLTCARRRIASIATYAVLDASVGAMLGRLRGDPNAKKRRQRRGHPLAAKLLGAAWWTATYLVVPVLAREPSGGLGAVSRSTRLMRETWKEAFVGRLVLGWLLWPAALLGLGLLTVFVAVGLGPFAHPAFFGVAAAIAVLGYIAIAAIAYTLDTVYRCALYVFATEGVVPAPFDDPDLHEIWTVRPDPA